jgi:hypothetical protein
MDKVRCPRCYAECDPGEPSCPSCGGYLGARRREPPPPPGPEPAEEERFGIPRPVWWFMTMFPGLFHPVVLILSLVAMVIAGALAWLALFLVIFGAMFAALMIGASGIICYWTGIAWLMHGELASPVEALSEFDSTRWLVFVLLATAPVVATAIYVQGYP